MTRIDVIQRDIEQGKRFTPNGCAIALAMRRKGYIVHASQKSIKYRKWYSPVWKEITPTPEVSQFISMFDLFGSNISTSKFLSQLFFPRPKPFSFEIP